MGSLAGIRRKGLILTKYFFQLFLLQVDFELQLKIKLAVYWDVNNPIANAAFRMVRHSPQKMNPLMANACRKVQVNPSIVNALLPKVFVFSVNPFETLFSVLDPYDGDTSQMGVIPSFFPMSFSPPVFKLSAWSKEASVDQNLEPWKVIKSDEGEHCNMCFTHSGEFGWKLIDEPAYQERMCRNMQMLDTLLKDDQK